jgi:toxin ParE1/3/4
MLRPAAAADVEVAYGWYEAQSDGLGEEFLSVLDRTLEDLRAHPDAAPEVHGPVRRKLLRRFPYGVFYRVVDGRMVVLACFRTNRTSPG